MGGNRASRPWCFDALQACVGAMSDSLAQPARPHPSRGHCGVWWGAGASTHPCVDERKGLFHKAAQGFLLEEQRQGPWALGEACHLEPLG